MTAWVAAHHPVPTEEEIRTALAAVVCRCTGYQGIVEAVQAAAGRMQAARKETTGG